MTVFFRLLIALSLILVGVSWWLIETLGIFFLPFIGIPVFLLAAFTTRFLKTRDTLLRVLFTGSALIATGYALYIATSGMAASYNELGTRFVTPTNARIASAAATVLFLCGQTGLWYVFFKERKRISR